MSTHDRLASALEAVVGAPWVYSDTTAAAYTIDGCQPNFVVFPDDEDQVAAVLRLADEHGATVFPRGSGSHMMLGNTPAHVDIVLSVQRLQQVLAYEPGDMTATVQAGLCLADLQQTLAANGQHLALDPSAAATTTIGGIVAANLSGPRRLLYGTARDLLLGSAVIGINGKRTKAGGRVVKNVTGYDLNKLYIGSLGTLAVIVELTWKLHPLPPGEHTMGIGVREQADLQPILRLLLELPLRLNSLTLLNHAAASDLARDADVAVPETPYCILARVEGTEAVLRGQEQRLSQALPRLSTAGPIATQTWPAEAPPRLWRSVAELPLTWQQVKPSSAVSKVSLRLADVPVFFRDMEAAAAGVPWPMFAHAGNGIVYICQSLDEASPADVRPPMQSLQALDDCVARLRGRRVIEYAPGPIKRQCDVWGTPGDDFALMRAIKASFDPHHRLNPGRFLGGL